MGKRAAVNPRIRALIEEAIVDAYTEGEQEVGFLTMMQDRISCPLSARVVGEDVQLLGFDLAAGDRGIVALCRRGNRRHRVGVFALEWRGRPPSGAEWIEAYRAWVSGGW